MRKTRRIDVDTRGVAIYARKSRITNKGDSIVDKDDERFCHIFIKGCTDEDYTGFFQTAGYIEKKATPVCDSEQYCICSALIASGI